MLSANLVSASAAVSSAALVIFALSNDSTTMTQLAIQFGLPIAMLAVLARYHAKVVEAKDAEIAKLYRESIRSMQRIAIAVSNVASEGNRTLDTIIGRRNP